MDLFAYNAVFLAKIVKIPQILAYLVKMVILYFITLVYVIIL